LIQINPNLSIDEKEISLEFIRSSGPGGQNVNKVATAVQLRFDVARSPSLPDEVRQRLLIQAHNRITEEGVLAIDSRTFRTQKANKEAAIERLVDIISKAAKKPVIRRKTRPTAASKNNRLEEKKYHSAAKRLRKQVSEED
jgi:ribosome-associated protein